MAVGVLALILVSVAAILLDRSRAEPPWGEMQPFLDTTTNNSPAVAQTVNFGPVIERVVADFAEDRSQACLDLDNNELRPPSGQIANALRLIIYELSPAPLEIRNDNALFD